MGLIQSLLFDDSLSLKGDISDLVNSNYEEYLRQNGYGIKDAELLNEVMEKPEILDKIKISATSEDDLLLDAINNFLIKNMGFEEVASWDLRDVKTKVINTLGVKYLKTFDKNDSEFIVVMGMLSYMKTKKVMDIKKEPK